MGLTLIVLKWALYSSSCRCVGLKQTFATACTSSKTCPRELVYFLFWGMTHAYKTQKGSTFKPLDWDTYKLASVR